MQNSKHGKPGVLQNILSEEKTFLPSKTFTNVTRECDVRFYTGFINTEIFQSKCFYYAILGWDKENFKNECIWKKAR